MPHLFLFYTGCPSLHNPLIDLSLSFDCIICNSLYVWAYLGNKIYSESKGKSIIKHYLHSFMNYALLKNFRALELRSLGVVVCQRFSASQQCQVNQFQDTETFLGHLERTSLSNNFWFRAKERHDEGCSISVWHNNLFQWPKCQAPVQKQHSLT